MQASDLWIKVDPKTGADRVLVVGAVGTGKSTMEGVLVNSFFRDYVLAKGKNKKPRGRILVVDTKPRWRASNLATGASAKRHYKHFQMQPILESSRLVTKSDEWDIAWQTGEGIVVLQNENLRQPDLIAWCVEMMEKFWRSQRRSSPGLVVIDEGMDFFGPTGNGKYGDIVQRIVRAGREKGIASLICSQRPKTINIQLISESNFLILFRINFIQDMIRLREMGIPFDLMPPREKYHFAAFRDERVITYDAKLRLE